MKIAILSGGVSGEREVSRRSAAALYEALSGRFAVELVDVRVAAVPESLDPNRHVILSALHGIFGEDGGMQALLDDAGFAYAGSDTASSRLCMDKAMTKERVAVAGVRVPEGVVFSPGNAPAGGELVKRLGERMVLKPNNEGSSIGLHFLDGAEAFEEKIGSLPDGRWMVERRVQGRELTVGILNGSALGIVEIIPNSGRFDYASKYTAGLTRYQWPAELPEERAAEIRRIAETAFEACGCRDFARVDFILSDAGEIFFLEINTLPGLTGTSLLPKSALCEGIDFQSLAEKLAEPALRRFSKLAG